MLDNLDWKKVFIMFISNNLFSNNNNNTSRVNDD